MSLVSLLLQMDRISESSWGPTLTDLDRHDELVARSCFLTVDSLLRTVSLLFLRASSTGAESSLAITTLDPCSALLLVPKLTAFKLTDSKLTPSYLPISFCSSGCSLGVLSSPPPPPPFTYVLRTFLSIPFTPLHTRARRSPTHYSITSTFTLTSAQPTSDHCSSPHYITPQKLCNWGSNLHLLTSTPTPTNTNTHTKQIHIPNRCTCKQPSLGRFYNPPTGTRSPSISTPASSSFTGSVRALS
ncbi:hypothetical protein LZ30DRAFT_430516 [Colletotrichum cereale]|nr:hypothetical protein LZ30DRAFT_430516 [Colletotrichum cereale]